MSYIGRQKNSLPKGVGMAPGYDDWHPKSDHDGPGVPSRFTKPKSGGEQRKNAIIEGTLRIFKEEYEGTDGGLSAYMETPAFQANAKGLGIEPTDLADILMEKITGEQTSTDESDVAKPPLS